MLIHDSKGNTVDTNTYEKERYIALTNGGKSNYEL